MREIGDGYVQHGDVGSRGRVGMLRAGRHKRRSISMLDVRMMDPNSFIGFYGIGQGGFEQL